VSSQDDQNANKIPQTTKSSIMSAADSRIAFIGLGNMGKPMALNAARAGYRVTGFDASNRARADFAAAGGRVTETLKEAVSDADYVLTMVNAGPQCRAVYDGDGSGVFNFAPKSALLVDCSTIDVATTRELSAKARAAGLEMIDAPVSGGVVGAANATLTFMVGGSESAFNRVKPVLSSMGPKIVHAGVNGNGQVAKICNNMITGISVIAVSEAFLLAERLGLDRQLFFDIASTSSGSCWAMTTYCPLPGPVATSPSSADYAPGFTTAMMLKDMSLSQDAARSTGASTPLAAVSAALYQALANGGHGNRDFSIIAKLLSGDLGAAEANK
jgi:3-hydroxyisobutyrate dehydrogenase